jgi:hypothetical protein
MPFSRVRVITADDTEMLFQAAPSEMGPVLQRIQGNQARNVDEKLNPAVPTWYGFGDGFSYPVREDGDVVRTVEELFAGLSNHELRQVETLSENTDIN